MPFALSNVPTRPVERADSRFPDRRSGQGWDALGLRGRGRRGAVAEGAAAELLAAVPGEPARHVRSLRDDARRVDLGVHAVVVLLDLREVDRVAEARRLEQVAGV